LLGYLASVRLQGWRDMLFETARDTTSFLYVSETHDHWSPAIGDETREQKHHTYLQVIETRRSNRLS
jgi:hypothetical protein